MRELTGDGVDVVLDGIGGTTSLRSFRALRPGGRLIVYGHYAMLERGRSKRAGPRAGPSGTGRRRPSRCGGCSIRVGGSWPIGSRRLRDSRQLLPVSGRHPARLVGGGPRNPEWFREDLTVLLELLRADKVHPVVAERLPLSEARHAHELLGEAAARGKLVLVP